MAEQELFAIYESLSTPTIVVDADYRIVYLNSSGKLFFRVSLADVAGQYPARALRLAPPTAQDMDLWAEEVVFPAIAAGDAFTAGIIGSDGHVQPVQLSVTRLRHDGQWYSVFNVLLGAQEDAPGWALTDPLTALHNRHQWERELEARNARGGVVIFLDLDNLKQINDLHGHRQGDQALIRVGAAIRRHLPPGALGVRFGGDEFVVVAHDLQEASARAVAERMATSAAAASAPQGGAMAVHLSYGVASYHPGGLLSAVERADEALYEQKGVLLRGMGGSRIILTGDARNRVSAPGSTAQPGEFGRGFGPQFDGYFRQMFARAVEQAREFVAFAAPEAGSAVIEVGAGSGRITFDGGLAQRIGSTGQLLVTDPSQPQLDVARRRAEELDLRWVRFLAAAAETLPVAPNTVDLVIGSTFLHFTHPEIAIPAMARLLRPGGRLALCANLNGQWGPAWQRAAAPIWAELEQQGVATRDFFLPRERLLELLARAGLAVERVAQGPRESASYPSAEVAVGFARQTRVAALWARGLPAERHGQLEEEFERTFRQTIHDLGPSAADCSGETISIVARRTAP